MSALDRKLLRDLNRMKGQVLAIAFVIAGGVALFVLSMTSLQSLNVTRAAYYDQYCFADVFAAATRAPEAVAERIREIPGVRDAETRIVVDVTLDLDGIAEPAIGRLVSIPDYDPPLLNQLALREGRDRDPGHPFEVLVSEAFADAHDLEPGDQVDAIINQRKQSFTIAGIALSPEYIYSMGPGNLFPDDRTFGVLWVPRSTLAAAFDLDGAFNSVSVKLLPEARAAPVIADIDRFLEPYGSRGAYDRDDQLSHFFLDNEMEQLGTIVRVLPPIFLGIAAFLLNIAIMRLIETERDQIGLFKAFGYSNRSIGWHYAKFVLATVALGLLIGSALGAWLGRAMTELYADFFRFPFLYFRATPDIFALAAMLSVAAGLGGTWTAVRRAVRLPPADAMRPAAPPTYRRTWIDRAAQALKVTQPSRIILRHIIRWPLRAALTVFGISASIALMIGSMFSIGAIDVMIDTQFFQAQRHHATLSYVEPRSDAALAETARLPGVMHAEGFRAVPVRLTRGAAEERTSLLGLDAASQLYRMLDRDRQPVTLPEEGLVMAESVAERLGVRAGDRLAVEVLDGHRPTLDLPITAVVEEYMGGTVAMHRRALNRHLLEGPVISGAHVLLDFGSVDAFYRQIKETPVIGAVSLQRTMLESFRQHVSETLIQMISINALFAGLIAFGVIYNSARIILSERARELASLRVLGFTRGEATYILLGELGVLTLLALPLGALLGYGLAAALSHAFATDLYTIPLVIEPSTYGIGLMIAIVAAILSGVVIGRRVWHLDLITVLKTRE